MTTTSTIRTLALAIAAAGLLAACASAPPCKCVKETDLAAAKVVVKEAPAEKPADPDLSPLMREVLVDLAAVQDTLDFDNTPQAHAHATRMAQSWSQTAHAKEDEDQGVLYAGLRDQMTGAIAGLVDATAANDTRRARGAYATAVGTCVACHAQSPAASGRVWLGRLLQGARP